MEYQTFSHRTEPRRTVGGGEVTTLGRLEAIVHAARDAGAPDDARVSVVPRMSDGYSTSAKSLVIDWSEEHSLPARATPVSDTQEDR